MQPQFQQQISAELKREGGNEADFALVFAFLFMVF
jgi:hypothetical protein